MSEQRRRFEDWVPFPGEQCACLHAIWHPQSAICGRAAEGHKVFLPGSNKLLATCRPCGIAIRVALKWLEPTVARESQ